MKDVDVTHFREFELFPGISGENYKEMSDCKSSALYTVNLKINFLYQVIGSVTLEGWVLMDVQWRCAKEQSATSDFE